MSAFILVNAYCMINSVDLSDHVRQITIDYSAETPEITAMGATSKARLGGLLDWKIDVEFNQDFAAAKVDATLWPLVGVPTAIIIKPAVGATSATNPAYSGSCILNKYPPLSGKVGDVAITKAEFVGTGTLARAVA